MNRALAQTTDWITSVQEPDGSIPWWPGGRTDAWNHTEALMALDAAGRQDLAESALRWLASSQRTDGAWPAATKGGAVADPTLDANFTAYPAAGLWHHWLCGGRRETVDELWGMVERAMDFVLDLQSADGSIYWARDERYRPWPGALLTSSACICLSLDCALRLAELHGVERPEWELALGELATAVARRPGAFENKARFSMDWYYPVLGGAVRGDAARARVDARWGEFVVEGRGIRCVADRPWVTVAETCELVIALTRVGRHDDAWELFEWSRFLRRDDGAYWTGATVPDLTVWPRETTTWSAGAVVLAAAVLSDTWPTVALFDGPASRLGIPAALTRPSALS